MTFGFLLFPRLEELDLIGPWEMIGFWGKYFQGPQRCFMVAEKMPPVICAKGLSINPHVDFSQCPPLDYLLVPGGEGTRTEVNNEALIRFVAEQGNCCKAVLSVCTGTFILYRAGLILGKRVTTHWASLDRLRTLGDVEVVEERVVQNGHIWTAAGVSAGIDLALAFIADVAGEKTASNVQLGSEYYPSDKLYSSAYKNEMTPQYLKRMYHS
ncbi:MAG: DJ-1/PfpI family protein [Deltaproteobacteria bacterium]|nr:DJ-1/PfpI family protein [Deltaproteobacteria bacterium]